MKLTIATVCRNSGTTLERTILSVLRQKTPEIEYLIIDGLSTDNTASILERYRASIDIIVSEQDTGIYDGMSKAMALAHGEYLWYLNADDWLCEGAVDLVLSSAKQYDYIFGISVRVDLSGAVKGLFLPAVDDNGRISDLVSQGTFLAHPAFAVRTELAKTLGFDFSFRLAADYDFMLRLYSESQNYRYLPQLFSYFQTDGASERVGTSELFAVQLKNWIPISASLDTFAKRRRYYRFLLERRSSTFHQHESSSIDRLMGLLRLPMVVKIALSLKYAFERWVSRG